MNKCAPDGPEFPMPPAPDRMEVVAMPAKKGRPKKDYDPQMLQEIVRLYFVERFSMRKVADMMGISHMSVYRMLSDPNIEVIM